MSYKDVNGFVILEAYTRALMSRDASTFECRTCVLENGTAIHSKPLYEVFGGCTEIRLAIDPVDASKKEPMKTRKTALTGETRSRARTSPAGSCACRSCACRGLPWTLPIPQEKRASRAAAMKANPGVQPEDIMMKPPPCKGSRGGEYTAARAACIRAEGPLMGRELTRADQAGSRRGGDQTRALGPIIPGIPAESF
jgi:hypothetical protein